MRTNLVASLICVLMILIGNSQDGPKSQQIPSEQKSNSFAENYYQSQEKKNGTHEGSSLGDEAKSKYAKSNSKPEKSECEKNNSEYGMYGDRCLKTTDVYLVIFNGLLAISTIGLILMASRQEDVLIKSVGAAHDANEQTRVSLEASQRPWVKANISIASGIEWDQGSGNFSLKFVLKNVGNAPALHVFPDFRMYPFELERAASAQKALSDSDKTRRLNPGRLGYTIFPGDDVETTISSRIDASTIEKWRARNVEIWAPNNIPEPFEATMRAVLVVCISYRSSLHKQPLQTGYIFDTIYIPMREGNAAPGPGDMRPSILGNGITM